MIDFFSVCFSAIFGEIFGGIWKAIRRFCCFSLVFNVQLLAAASDPFQKSTHSSLQVKLVLSAQD